MAKCAVFVCVGIRCRSEKEIMQVAVSDIVCRVVCACRHPEIKGGDALVCGGSVVFRHRVFCEEEKRFVFKKIQGVDNGGCLRRGHPVSHCRNAAFSEGRCAKDGERIHC